MLNLAFKLFKGSFYMSEFYFSLRVIFMLPVQSSNSVDGMHFGSTCLPERGIHSQKVFILSSYANNNTHALEKRKHARILHNPTLIFNSLRHMQAKCTRFLGAHDNK